MSDPTAAPTFNACEAKRGSGWSVLVAWPDDRHQYLDGFQSFDEAVAWVSEKSQAWLAAQQNNSSPSAPRRHDHVWSRFETSGVAKPPATMERLVNVIRDHRDSSKEDRKARGEAFKDEQEPK